MDFTKLSLSDVRTQLEAVAREAQAAFGALDARQLNWRPDEARWSVAQCLTHLLTANRLMLQAADDALDETRPRTAWQRVPILPAVFGRAMIRSQAPDARRQYVAPPTARPASSDIARDVVARFVEQQREAAGRASGLDARRAARVVMASPFIRVVTYSVLDGWRLMVAHDWRHVEQARRVTRTPGFPGRPEA